MLESSFEALAAISGAAYESPAAVRAAGIGLGGVWGVRLGLGLDWVGCVGVHECGGDEELGWLGMGGRSGAGTAGLGGAALMPDGDGEGGGDASPRACRARACASGAAYDSP